MDRIGWMAWAVLAGAGIPVMAALNGALARALGSAQAAAIVLFAIGLCTSTLFATISGDIQKVGNLWCSGIPPQMLAGGVIVAFYIFSVTSLVPRHGVGDVILFVMIAQICTSAAIDHFGILGAEQRPVDVVRFAGLIMVVAGLALTQLPTRLFGRAVEPQSSKNRCSCFGHVWIFRLCRCSATKGWFWVKPSFQFDLGSFQIEHLRWLD